jgi:NADH dehydrogenase
MEHRVVIVGCGFGGLFAARALKRAPVSLTVVDRRNHHLFQPLLYQMSTGILSEGDIAPPIRSVLRRQANATVLMGDVESIDVAGRSLRVRSADGIAEVPYDSLIVAAGAQQSYFGHPEFEEFAPGMKSIEDAHALRAQIFGAFEAAEAEPDPDRRRSWLTFVVVGAGATGVEMAGQIVELSRRALRRNFRRIDPADARVVLLDAGPTVLAAFPAGLQERSARALTRLGVELHVNAPVTGVDAAGVDVGADDPTVRRIDARTRIWCAGVEASPLGAALAEQTGATADRAGRVEVLPNCTLPGHPEVFVIGDLMSLDRLPGVAEVAMQSGRYAARTIRRRLDGDAEGRPFRYRDLGTMATISRFKGVAWIGPVKTVGFLGWVLWLIVHLAFLTGFKNRVFTLANWTIAFLGSSRPQRVISLAELDAAAARKPPTPPG